MKHMKLLLIPILALGVMACQNNDQAKTTTPETSQEKEIVTDLRADDVPSSAYNFKDLPYAADALQPHIDAHIMELHYGKHHKGYYKKFLNALEGTPVKGKSLTYILSNIDKYDAGVRNNAGGYYNHWVYWDNMSTEGGGKPGKILRDEITSAFGTWDNFVSEFNDAAGSQFGSGWAWLILTKEGELEITNTPNQDNPLMSITDMQGYPLLAIDVWEHAYYLQYENKRTDYIKAFWNVIDWEEVGRRYQMAKEGHYYMP